MALVPHYANKCVSTSAVWWAWLSSQISSQWRCLHKSCVKRHLNVFSFESVTVAVNITHSIFFHSHTYTMHLHYIHINIAQARAPTDRRITIMMEKKFKFLCTWNMILWLWRIAVTNLFINTLYSKCISVPSHRPMEKCKFRDPYIYSTNFWIEKTMAFSVPFFLWISERTIGYRALNLPCDVMMGPIHSTYVFEQSVKLLSNYVWI